MYVNDSLADIHPNHMSFNLLATANTNRYEKTHTHTPTLPLYPTTAHPQNLKTSCDACRDYRRYTTPSPVALHVQPLQLDQSSDATDLGDLVLAQPKFLQRRAPFQPRNRPCVHEKCRANSSDTTATRHQKRDEEATEILSRQSHGVRRCSS